LPSIPGDYPVSSGQFGLFKMQLTVRTEVIPLGAKLKVAILSIHVHCLLRPTGNCIYELPMFEQVREKSIICKTGSVLKGLNHYQLVDKRLLLPECVTNGINIPNVHLTLNSVAEKPDRFICYCIIARDKNVCLFNPPLQGSANLATALWGQNQKVMR
jgi:hypothetical protein